MPARLLTEPERLMLAAAWVFIGLDSLIFGAPSSGLAGAPLLLRIESGAVFLIGGLATLVGVLGTYPWLERLGQAFVTLGCGIFIYAVVMYVGTPAVPVAVLYVLVALTYALRMLGQSAQRLRERVLTLGDQ